MKDDPKSDVPARKYDRVLLKISGEALMGDQGFGLHPPTVERISSWERASRTASIIWR